MKVRYFGTERQWSGEGQGAGVGGQGSEIRRERAEIRGRRGRGRYMLGKISAVALSKPHFPTDKRNHDQDATTIGAAMIPHDTRHPENPCRFENCKVLCCRGLS